MPTVRTESHQTCRNSNPGTLASSNAGTANVRMRDALLTSPGSVLPIAWKSPEQVKMSPDATKFHEMNFRNSALTTITAGSFVNTATIAAGLNWVTIVMHNISTLL